MNVTKYLAAAFDPEKLGAAMDRLGISRDIRAEKVSPEQFRALAELLEDSPHG